MKKLITSIFIVLALISCSNREKDHEELMISMATDFYQDLDQWNLIVQELFLSADEFKKKHDIKDSWVFVNEATESWVSSPELSCLLSEANISHGIIYTSGGCKVLDLTLPNENELDLKLKWSSCPEGLENPRRGIHNKFMTFSDCAFVNRNPKDGLDDWTEVWGIGKGWYLKANYRE